MNISERHPEEPSGLAKENEELKAYVKQQEERMNRIEDQFEIILNTAVGVAFAVESSVSTQLAKN